ncbi:hypothetical protein Vafri_22009 [Volvox africanus]|uniref:Uncharacterized protein n=1 Tax=Volvox africanus TaxID=51714 RepID=A0A8J4C064_9CHLO|nr:hypothetical protein Vafri_22009 [Volvox africanus]
MGSAEGGLGAPAPEGQAQTLTAEFPSVSDTGTVEGNDIDVTVDCDGDIMADLSQGKVASTTETPVFAARAKTNSLNAASQDEDAPEHRSASVPEEAAPVDTATPDLVLATWQAMERYAPLPQPLAGDDCDPSNFQQQQEQLVDEHRVLQELLLGALNGLSDTGAAGACPASGPDESASDLEEYPSEEDKEEEKEEEEERGREPSAEDVGRALEEPGGVSSQPSTSGGIPHKAEQRRGEFLWKRRRRLMAEEMGGLLPPLLLTESASQSLPPHSSPPSADLQTHLDSVAASLIKRHCTVPVTDPLVTAYGSVYRDAVQL